MVAATKYTEEEILDAAAMLVAESGLESVSVAAIARSIGAPSGSMYHRFASRQHLLGALWVRTTTRYATSLALVINACSRSQLAERIVNHTFDWVAQHPRDAALLMRLRTEDFDPNDWPVDIVEAITTVNNDLVSTMTIVAEEHGIDPLDMTLAVIDVPAALARRSILLGTPDADRQLRQRSTELVDRLLADDRCAP